ncbi:MAG TPA: DUF4270 family protein [Saprospiraceae bacterium]|nr:DUF4270 family protein [Saprospiraceae bacterium]
MTLTSRLFFFILILSAFVFSCTQPVTIGSDFLGDEKNGLKFEDHFGLTFHTEKADSIVTHNGDNASYQLSTYLCGNIVEPVFGRSTAELYVQPLLPTVGTDLIGATIDSVVLQLRYDTLGNYGDLTGPVTLEVYQLLETPNHLSKYYSNQRFMSSPDLLGSLTFIPRPKDSLNVISFGDTLRYAPHVRINLDPSKFASLLAQDTVIYTNQDSFLNFFHGLYIRMTGSTNTMLGFNLLNSLSGLSFYYNTPTAVDHHFQFIFSSMGVNHVYMEHDYTNSLVGTALGPDAENDYWFQQGMAGIKSDVTISGLDQLGHILINEADLEFYATFPEGDNEMQYLPCPYITALEKTDTTFNYSTDVSQALTVAQGSYTSAAFKLLFGGNREERNPGPPVVYRYNMKVTNQVREIMKGSKENIIYFNPFSKGNVPNRAVLFGPNHPTYAPRLRIYYTIL